MYAKKTPLSALRQDCPPCNSCHSHLNGLKQYFIRHINVETFPPIGVAVSQYEHHVIYLPVPAQDEQATPSQGTLFDDKKEKPKKERKATVIDLDKDDPSEYTKMVAEFWYKEMGMVKFGGKEQKLSKAIGESLRNGLVNLYNQRNSSKIPTPKSALSMMKMMCELSPSMWFAKDSGVITIENFHNHFNELYKSMLSELNSGYKKEIKINVKDLVIETREELKALVISIKEEVAGFTEHQRKTLSILYSSSHYAKLQEYELAQNIGEFFTLLTLPERQFYINNYNHIQIHESAKN